MPLEALLFVMQHIWVAIFVLTLGISIGTGITFGLDIVSLLITLGMFVLFFVPIASIGHNIVQSRKDIRKVLCCVPLLITALYQTTVVVLGYTKFMIYESHPDSLVYTLLFLIQKLGETAIYPTTDKIYYMGFPYNQLPQFTAYIIVFPISLLIYLLPSIDYDRIKITKEMKLIALLPLLCVGISIIVQTVKMRLGLIDELMIKFFWSEILST
ncbi:MAG: hypothetical protein QM426_05380 [Euryarchaeota archaeon]|nr:hypothetical protein [Euryarchaeota archaeon]